MQIHPKDRGRLVDAAMGRIPCDLLIHNVKLFNVFTWETYEAEVGIVDGFIACVSADPDGEGGRFEIEAHERYDGRGQFLIPGFIDSHLHIESSMMTPAHMAEAVLPMGTTTLITDPHEVANVGGVEAVAYMLAASEDLPMRFYVLAPSCIPSAPGLENAGASFGAAEVERLMAHPRVLGVAELMDYPGVLSNSSRMRAIMGACEKRGGFMQGHAPFLSGRDLNAYLAAGVRSDHETRTGREAREKLRLGMNVDMRESSVSMDVEAIAPAVLNFRSLTNLSLCTDDLEPEDILTTGHVSRVAASAVRCGMSPEQAVVCGTLNAAREIGITNLGAVAPGFAADLQIVPALACPRPGAVFAEGRLVAEDGRLALAIEPRSFPQEKVNTVRLRHPGVEDLKIRAEGDAARVRVVRYATPKGTTTEFGVERLPVLNGCLNLGGDPDLKFVAVLNRHGLNTRFVGVVRGFGTQRGAYGATVSHDCHNLVVVYDTPEDALVVIEALIECGGGKVAALDGRVIARLELPIYGLIARLPAAELARDIADVKAALRGKLGLDVPNPLMRIVSLALPVIPKAKFSDLGLVDVLQQRIVPLFVE